MTGESSTDMYTQSGVKWRAGDELPCGTGPGPLMTPRGRMWGGEGAPQRGAVWIITAHSRAVLHKPGQRCKKVQKQTKDPQRTVRCVRGRHSTVTSLFSLICSLRHLSVHIPFRTT